ncbi:hypothetical protein TWF481_007046 [Arthrobotrys musiformis]|uniref:RRM domain-containing protein n=1 Tax=Arthrobotrys musiformis TaxID=47236 RepID=A0AAV9WCL5_9PEZI
MGPTCAKKPSPQVPEIITQSPSPARPTANNNYLPFPSRQPSNYDFQSRSPTPLQQRKLPQMQDEPKVKVSKPLTRTQTKRMQEGIIQNFCDRVHDLEEAVGAKTAEAEKLQVQIGEIVGLAKGAQDCLQKAIGHNKLAQESLSQLEVALQKIAKLDITSGDKVASGSQPLVENLPPGGKNVKVKLEAPPASTMGKGERTPIALTQAGAAPQPKASGDTTNLFDFYGDDKTITKNTLEAKKPMVVQQAPYKHRPGLIPPGVEDPFVYDDYNDEDVVEDPFFYDDAAVEAEYAKMPQEKVKTLHGSGSNQTIVAARPADLGQRLTPAPPQKPAEGPANTPFQKLATVMGSGPKDSNSSLLNKDTVSQQPVLPEARTNVVNAGPTKLPHPVGHSGASSTGLAAYTVKFTTLPPDFYHNGNFPGTPSMFYEEAQLCDRGSYTSEKVPVLRLQDVPNHISLADIFESLAGGPIYRISATKTDPDDPFKHVRVTFIHLHHAEAFLEFAQKRNGIYIKGCPDRIQVVPDPREKPNVISYTTFRKMMTENVTRMVYIDGFREGFWTTRKLRDLIVAAVDKLRVEDPDRYQFKEPICDKSDIVTAILGNSKERGIEALVGLRSIGWAILVRIALHGLQQPEGFYTERVVGDIGPDVSATEDPANIPSLRAFWVPDTVDEPLENMEKNFGDDA